MNYYVILKLSKYFLGSAEVPNTGHTRAIFIIFWLTSVCLYAYYTARLVSFLTVSVKSLPFSTLSEAVVADGWSVGVQEGTSTFSTIRVRFINISMMPAKHSEMTS